MTRQKRRFIVLTVAAVLLFASIVPAFTVVSVRWAQLGVAAGAELYQYVEHDHDWAAEIAVAEAEVAERNDFANWYVGLEHWGRVAVAVTAWATLALSSYSFFIVLGFELDYQERKKKAIKVRPVAY